MCGLVRQYICPAASLFHHMDLTFSLLNICPVHNGVLVQNRDSLDKEQFLLSQYKSLLLMNNTFFF